MTTISKTKTEPFAESYPKFRLLTAICICYWTVLLILLFSRNDRELADAYSFLLYSGFVITHIFILLATIISDKLKKGQKLVFIIAIVPFIFSIIAILISIFSYGSIFLEMVFKSFIFIFR